MALLIMLVPFANTNNILSNSNVIGQAYGENYRSYYPTNDYKYECKKGPFEGFFVESVEFCDQKLPVKDPIEKKDKDAIVNIEKKLFVCNAERIIVEEGRTEFLCPSASEFNAAGPDSGEYVPCTADLCPGIDESEFAVQIFKDVATVHDLTPQGTPVNLNKFHYTVAENDISSRINFDDNQFLGDQCFPTGFDHSLTYQKELEDSVVAYQICVKYVGDCDGTIYPGQVKTCTVENYIWFGVIVSFEDNSLDRPISATTGTTTSQSNNAITTTTTQSSNAGVPQSSNAGVPQSSNAIPTTTTTQSSNNVVGVPQSSNIGAATAALQSSSVGTPITFSSAPSSPFG